MNHFSDTSKKRLETCHKDLRVLFAHVVIDFDCTIVEGFRGESEQNKAYDEGKSKLRFPNSKHNKRPSLAVDAAPFINGAISWKHDDLLFFSGYVKGIADQLYRMGVIGHRIRCGSDWDKDGAVSDETFRDEPHYEIIPNERDV
ncbi:MAG: hypothetical protein ABFC18_03435 [Rikenellaceae bacterium]